MSSVQLPLRARFGAGLSRRVRWASSVFLAATFAAAAVAAPDIVVTKTTDAPGTRKSQGDSITYTITVANNGADAATGVSLTDSTPANTSLVGGSVKVTPIAFDDTYGVVGNTERAVAAESGLLANDVDPDDATAFANGRLTVKAGSVERVSGSTTGSLTVNADGSFTYRPAVGVSSGTERFKYTVVDADGQDSVSAGYIDFSITGRVWYVQSGGSGDGRSHAPLGDPATASASATLATDIIYVLYHANAVNGAFSLDSGQQLMGQAVALTAVLDTNGTSGTVVLVPAASAPVLTNTGGVAVTLSNGGSSAANSIRGVILGAANTALAGTNFGTVTIADVAINNPSGGALSLDTGTLAGTGFTSITSTSTAGRNVSLTSIATSGTFALGSGALSGSSGTRFHVSGGTGSFTYSGTITSTGASAPVLEVLNNKTAGTLTLSGAITAGSSGTPRAGSGLTINPGHAAAVVNLTGPLTLHTSTGAAFTASSGTFSANNANNVLNTTTGVALNVTNATVGAGGLVFKSISANGATNGIVFTNTGANAGLTILGDGSPANNGSGGVIQNTTGTGIVIAHARGVTLNQMNVTNSGADGINVTNINGLAITRCTISDTAGAVTDQGIQIGDFITGTAVNGTITIAHTNVTRSPHDNLAVGIASGTSSWAIDHCTFSFSGAGGTNYATSAGNNGVTFEIRNSATVTALGFANNTLTGNYADGLQIAPAASATGSLAATISGNTFSNNSTALDLVGLAGASMTYTVTSNTIVNSARNATSGIGGTSHAVNVFQGTPSTGTLNLRFDGNTIGSAELAGSGSSLGNGLRVNFNDGGQGRVVINNNTIRQCPVGRGIEVIGRNGNGQLDVTVTNNNVDHVNTGFFPGTSDSPLAAILVQSHETALSSPTHYTVRSDIRGNTVPSGTAFDVLSTFLIAAESEAAGSTSNHQLVNTSGAGSATNQLTGTNTGSASATAGVSLISGPINTPPLLLGTGGVERPSTPMAEVSIDIPPFNSVVHDAGASPAVPPVVVPAVNAEAGVLSQASLDAIVAIALARWEQTSLSVEQRSLLRGLRFEVASLSDYRLGEAAGSLIRVDDDAGGNGWFVDQDGWGDTNFAHATSATRRYTDAHAAPAGRIDLLTAILHEMGHALGLEDTYLATDRDNLMYGYLTKGERRLPVAGQAEGAVPSHGVTHFLSAPISIGTLPAGKSVAVTFQVTITARANVSNQASVSGSNFSTATSNTVATEVNQPPVVTAIAKSGAEENAIVFAAADFTSRFSDPNGDSLASVTIVSLPQHGTLTLGGGTVSLSQVIGAANLGALVYTPASDYHGSDSFSWNATDNSVAALSAVSSAAVNISIAPVADEVSITSATTAEDTPSSSGLVVSRHASDGAEITHFKITNISNGQLFQRNGTTPIANGDMITFAQGSAGLVFTPDENKNTAAGDIFSFDVAGATDANGTGLGSATTASVTVTAVNDAPVPSADSLAAVDEDSAARTIPIFALIANDTSGPANEADQELTITGVSNAVGGTVAIEDTNVIFTLTADFAGTASFDYTVQDNGLTDGEADPQSATGSASFTVNAINDAPTLTAPTTLKGAPNAPVTITGLGVTDIDAGSSLVRLVLSAGEGTFAAVSGGGVVATGGNTAMLTLMGAIDDLNTFLDGGNITYAAIADATISVVVTDNGNTGSGGEKTASASIQVARDRAPVAGFGGALLLERPRSEGVQIAHHAALNFGAGSFTVEAWIKRAGSGTGFFTIAGKQVASGGAGWFFRFNDDVLSFAAGMNSVNTTATITDTAWHHVAAVHDATAKTVAIYIDGELSERASFTHPSSSDSIEALGLGFKPNYGEYFAGSLDDVRLWNTARTLAEIREFMHTPLSGAESGLVGYWNFEGTGPTVENYTIVAGLDGTVQNVGGAAERVSGNIGYSVTIAEDSGATTLRLGGSDFEHNATTFALITSLPAHGELYHADGIVQITTASPGSPVTVIDAAGSPRRVVYVPNADFNGSDSFTYIVNDGAANSANTATVSLTITGQNDAPTAIRLTQSKSAIEGGVAVALDDIAVTDVDSGDTITATLTLSTPAAGSLSTGTYGSSTSTFNAGTGVWTVTGSVPDVNAALAAVAFIPSANNDQNFTIATRVRDAANTGPADGTISFTVMAVNDAPTATNLTQSKAATEGGGAVALDDIVVTDADTGDTITATLTLSNPAAGSLSTGTYGSATSTYNAGTGVWTVTGSVSDVNDALAAVALTPSANNDQNFTIATRIRDAANSGPADGTIAFTVTAVNDAPTATNLTQSKTATEGGGAVALDDIVVTDPDTGDAITATLTLSSSVSGTLSTGTFGSATSTFNAGTGVWSVTGSVADVNAALAAVAFTPSANNDLNFTIGTRIRDAANTGPADGAISFVVTGVNDAPTATNLTQSKAAIEAGSAVALDDIVVADVDTADAITATLTLSDPAAGSLSTGTYGSATSTFNAGTGVWRVTGSVADVNAALAAVALTPSANNDQNFTITTRIRDAANTGPADGAISFAVTAVNDAPTATHLTQSKSATEEGSAVALDDIVVTDPDTGDTITATLTLSDTAAGTLSTGTYGSATSTFSAGTGVWAVTGSVADVNAALAAVALTPSADNDQNFTITIRVRDAANTGPADGTISFTVTAVNDAPIVTTSGGTTAYTEDGAAVAIDPGLTVGDIDDTALEGATVAITGNFQSSEDALGFSDQNGITGAYDSGTGVLTLTGTSSVAHYQAALRSVAYSNTSDTPNTANRTLTFVVNDGEIDSLPATKTLSVAAANDPAVVTTSSGITAFIEGNNVTSTPVAVDPQLTVSDADSATLASATVSITSNLQSSEDRLAFTNDDATAYGNIDGSHDNLTGVFVLSSDGATASTAQWQNALRAVTYRNLSQTPNEATRTIAFVVNDGADSSVAATKDVSVTAVNDTPVLTVSPTASYTENSAATSILTGEQNTLSDADHANLARATAVISGGFTADGDTLAADTTGTAITATWDASSRTLTLAGSDSQANYGAVLGRVTFVSTGDNPTNFGANPTRTITWQVDDGAAENNLSATQTTTVTITAVNDAPTITGASAGQSVTDKTTLAPFSAVVLADVDHATVSVTITLDAAAKGALSNLGAGSYDAGTGIYAIAGAPALVTTAVQALVFTPAENRVVPGASETTTFTIAVDDGDAATVTDGATTVISVSVNDAPTDIGLSHAAVSQSAGANAMVGTLAAVDVDTGETFTYALVAGAGSDDNASFNLSGRTLRVTAPLALAPRNYSVRVQAKDGSEATVEKSFTIAVSDDVAATIQSITGPAAKTYGAGETLDFSFVFSEPVIVDTAGGTPVLTLTVGGVSRTAVYISGSGTTTLVFRYVVQPGDRADSGEVNLVQIELEGGTIKDASGNHASLAFTPPAFPDVLIEASFHSADTDRNWRLSLLELTRVIELYNTRDGTTRTGAYHTDATTEDGFAAGTGTIASHHSADTNRDGRLSLLELTRVIELYNTRDGTARTGEYHRTQAVTEDGFAPGRAN